MASGQTDVAATPTPINPVKSTKVMDLGEYIRDVAPYTEEQEKLITAFYKKRERHPTLFNYNKAGDLVIFNKSGTLEDTIRLKTFVPLDPEQRTILDQERLDALGEAEIRYESAMETLRAATAAAAIQPVLAAQRAVAEADQVLTRIRYGTRGVQAIPNPEVRAVHFDKPKETKRLFPNSGDPYKRELYRLIVRELPLMKSYGNYVDTPVGAEEETKTGEEGGEARDSDATIRQKLRDGRWARIFFDVDDGPSSFLSPFWPVEFTMEGDDGDIVRYYTASQAWEYLRAKEAGKEDLMKAILGSRSVRSMRWITRKLATQPKNSKEAWLKIFTEVYDQHPELKAKLLATGTDALVFADVREGPSGTGYGERAKDTLDPTKWTGENAVGFALETLRYRLREGTVAEGTAAGAPTDAAVITEEQQAAARTGAIIGQRKKFFIRPRPGAA